MRKTFRAIKEEFRFRKAVALLLLIAAGAFLVLNSDSLYYTTKYYNGMSASKNKDVYKTVENERATEENLSYLDISDGTVIKQEFTAEEAKIRDVRLMFRNTNYYEAGGNIDITLEDSGGEVLGAASFTLDQISNKKFLVSSFIADSDVYNSSRIVQSKNMMPEASDGIVVSKGDRYTITIKAEGVKNADDFALCLVRQDPDEVSVLSADGGEVKDRIFFGYFTYSIFSYPVLVFLIFMLFLTALMVITPWGALSSRVNGKRADDKAVADMEVWIQRAVFMVTPAVCFWMNYKISGKKLSEIAQLFFTKFGSLNLAIIIALLAVLYLITNSKRVSSAVSTFLTAALTISCYFLILFRNIPLRACDFADIGTAADVAGNYEFTINKSLMWVVTVAVCMIALNISFKRTKGLGVKPRVALLLCTCAICAGIYLPLSDPDFSVEHNLQIKGFDPAGQYRVKGYVLGFTISFRDMHIQKPEGYSVDAAEEVAKDYRSDESVNAVKVSEGSPNIIVIMNEAFSDLSVMGELETNEDYMPFFRSLNEDAVKGMMHVSTFGGGTAKTEFEFLTGNTDAFLRSKTAYTNLIKDESPSLARTLKDQGYTGMIAFHPGKSDSYNRNNVYPYFGFDKYISIDDMEDPEKIREYVSDKECYDTIIEQFEAHEKEDADSPFFLFNVTIQNHGGFGYSTGIVDAGIEITDSELKLERPEQYLNLIKESDIAFEDLIEYFKAQDEPTAIVMFGDHQPGIGTEFYEEMADRADKEVPDIERTDRRYQVPFVIWTNYDIEEEEDVDISANMLSAYMLNKLGLRMTGYDKFLVDLHSRIPSLSSIAYYDSQGSAYEMDAENEGDLYMGDEILKYHYLQYNNMNKSSERIEDFFTLAK